MMFEGLGSFGSLLFVLKLPSCNTNKQFLNFCIEYLVAELAFKWISILNFYAYPSLFVKENGENEVSVGQNISFVPEW